MEQLKEERSLTDEEKKAKEHLEMLRDKALEMSFIINTMDVTNTFSTELAQLTC